MNDKKTHEGLPCSIDLSMAKMNNSKSEDISSNDLQPKITKSQNEELNEDIESPSNEIDGGVYHGL